MYMHTLYTMMYLVTCVPISRTPESLVEGPPPGRGLEVLVERL